MVLYHLPGSPTQCFYKLVREVPDVGYWNQSLPQEDDAVTYWYRGHNPGMFTLKSCLNNVAAVEQESRETREAAGVF